MKHIVIENGKYRYFDRNYKEIKEGDKVQFDNGRIQEVYLTVDGLLGTDATNPVWIEIGRAAPCEYGIYPFEEVELEEAIIVEEK